MIFGTPISWFLYELVSVVLFFACIVHAGRRASPNLHVLTLLGFVVYAGTFENIGVWSGSYDYSVDRVMLIGKVPLSILLVESVIFYAATWLAAHLRIRWWAAPVVIGFLGSYQDLTIDPSNVFDVHRIDGQLSGQWNWAMNYDGSLFGIPFFNFSGWMTMMLFYALSIVLIRRWAQRRGRSGLAELSPLVAIVPSLALLTTVNRFLLFAWPFAPANSMATEIVMLVINFGVAILLLLRFSSLNHPLSLRRDWAVFAVPVALHAWDIVIAFALGIDQAYVPSILFGTVHVALLALVVVKGRANAVTQDVAVREPELVA